MNDDLDEARELLSSLRRSNVKGEPAEDCRKLLKFTADTFQEIPKPDDAFRVVVRVVDLLVELGWPGSRNEEVFRSREQKAAWSDEFVRYLDALVQLDSSAARFGFPNGYFYVNDEKIRSRLQVARQMLEGYSLSEEQIGALVRQGLAGDGEAHDFRLAWVSRRINEASPSDISSLVGPTAWHDRPAGGGARKDLKVARAAACRRLHAVLPDFARRKWALQASLLIWAGLGDVTRNDVQQAVVGNRRRMD